MSTDIKVDIKRELEFIKTYVGTVLGVETLEFYDGNLLSGDIASRSKEKIVLLQNAINGLDCVLKNVK